MDLINQFFDEKKKELEDAFDEWHAGKDLWKLPGGVSPREEEAFVNFTQELGKTAGDVLDLPAVEVVKLLFIYSSFYFLIMQDIIRLKTKDKPEDFDKAAVLENGRVTTDHKKIMDQILYQVFSDISQNDSEEDTNEKIKRCETNLVNLSSCMKDFIRELCEQKFYTVQEAVSFSRLTEENQNYFSSALFLNVKKSFKGFIENGKCPEQVFPFVLVMLLDFLNNKGIEQNQKIFSDEVMSYFYYVVFSYDKNAFLTLFSDILMNKVFINTLLCNYVVTDPPDEEHKLQWIQKWQEKFPQYFCFCFTDEQRIIQILKIGEEKEREYYEPLLMLYNLNFKDVSAGKDEFAKEKNIKNLFTDILERYNNQISDYPGFCFCFAYLIKYLRKNEIENIFGKKDVIPYKQEWIKVEQAKQRVHEGFGPLDKENFKFIWDSQTQKQQDEDFQKRALLLKGIFYARLYLVLYSVRGNLTDFEFNQAVWDLCLKFHDSFIHPDYVQKIKKNQVIDDFSKLILGKDLFSDIEIDCINNSAEVISVVSFLSRYDSDNLHAVIDFLNHVREKQKLVLPIVPNKYLSYTKEEAKKEKKRLKENQPIIKNHIDPGFTISFWQNVSSIGFQIPVGIPRRMTIKSFAETDKKYSIYYYKKKKGKNVYYRLDKKEDFRITNKNHLENHYLYPGRNVFTHNTANYLVIENLLDEDKTESLLFALYDIKKFLNRLEGELKENKAKLDKEDNEDHKMYLSGIAYLQNDFSELLKKMWKVIIQHNVSDPWKEVFYKDQGEDKIRNEYKERINNLDYNHDFGPSFLKLLNDFLVKIYYASPDFLKACPNSIFLYLIFQNFALEKYRK